MLEYKLLTSEDLLCWGSKCQFQLDFYKYSITTVDGAGLDEERLEHSFRLTRISPGLFGNICKR
jgi:hypothetical protein